LRERAVEIYVHVYAVVLCARSKDDEQPDSSIALTELKHQ